MALISPNSTTNKMEQPKDEIPERAAASSPLRAASKAHTRDSMPALFMSSASIRRSQVFQRRLKEKISESRALELLDRKIKSESSASPTELDRTGVGSNQNQDDELVCDSTMVTFEAASGGPEECETRASSVLKTVRGIHRQRARDQQTPTRENENQGSWA